MNDMAFENRFNQDIDQTKQDITTLGNDNVAGIARIKKDLVTLGDDGAAGLTMKFEQLADDTTEMVTEAIKTMNKDLGHGLSQYNAKVQVVADRVPGGLGKKATVYPWVTVTISLVFGMLLGLLLKPGRQPVG
jgi:hypothetical protein